MSRRRGSATALNASDVVAALAMLSIYAYKRICQALFLPIFRHLFFLLPRFPLMDCRRCRVYLWPVPDESRSRKLITHYSDFPRLSVAAMMLYIYGYHCYKPAGIPTSFRPHRNYPKCFPALCLRKLG